MRERRKASRYSFGATGRLHLPRQVTGANVVVRVISTLGCELEDAEVPEPGKKCEVYLDWQDVHIGVEAEVVWKRRGRMGLKFLSLDRESHRRLRDLCQALSMPQASTPAPEPAKAAASAIDFKPIPLAEHVAPLPTAPSPPPQVAAAQPAKRERRRVPRYVSELRAHVRNPGTGETRKVRLITLSILGGCLEGGELPDTGQNCDLNTEWQGRPLRVAGHIVWKSKGGRAGLRFTALDETTDRLLRQICSNLRLQPLAPLPPGGE